MSCAARALLGVFLVRGEAGGRVMWALPSLGAVVLRGPKHVLLCPEQRHAKHVRVGRAGFSPATWPGPPERAQGAGPGALGYGAVLS